MCKKKNSNFWKDSKPTDLNRDSEKSGAKVQPREAFLIVTEGKVTENYYFRLLRDKLRLPSSLIQVFPGESTDPRMVVKEARDKAKEQKRRADKGLLPLNEPSEFNHVWAVVDTDVAKREEYWPDLKKLAKDNNVNLAHSTPCFEYWLILHLRHTTKPLVNGGGTEKELKGLFKEKFKCSYSKEEKCAKDLLGKFLDYFEEALKNAEQVRSHHSSARTKSPADPSTEVDCLVGALRDSARSS